MKSKTLNEAVDAIKSNRADAREIQSKLTYSELIPLLFKKNYEQTKPEKSYNKEQRRETGKYIDVDAMKNLIQNTPHIVVKGINASPGLALGRIACNYNTMEKLYEEDKNLVFMRNYVTPHDVTYLQWASAIITSEGGATSHAAVFGKQFTIPTVTGCHQIKVDYESNTIVLAVEDSVYEYYEGETDVLVDGTSGKVYFFSSNLIIREDEMLSTIDTQDDTVETISNFIYTKIQNHEIFSYGLELAYLIMILKLKGVHSLPEISGFAVDFEYLSSFKQDGVLWMILLPILQKLCSRIKDFVTAAPNNRTDIKKDLLLMLSRLNDMAIKSIDHRHQMILLIEDVRKIDDLVAAYDFEAGWTPQIASPNILVVEDEPYLVADTIQRLKNELNANVNIVTNAHDAIEIIKSGAALDLAIIDLMIPGGRDQNLDLDPYKGVDVSQVIKETKGENFPVIFLTSVRDINILGKLFNSTVSRVINKPSLVSSILDTVKEMLQNTNLSDANLLQVEIQRRKLELESPDPSMRIRALWALFQYANHDSEIISKINKMAENDSYDQVRLVAQKILAQPIILKKERFDDQQKIRATNNRSVIIQGNVQNSIIILGDENSVQAKE